jgi:hypothetical protein
MRYWKGSTSVLDKFIDAITSTECLAAFLGVLAAFLLEAIRRWRADRLAELAAGNEAIFALCQMFTHTANINNQMFVAHSAEFRDKSGRHPTYAEILPMQVSADRVLRLQLDRLGFLLRSHDPDVLNRLATTALDFDVLMKLLEERNAQHLEWQRESARALATPHLPDPVPFEMLEQLVGIHRSFLLRHMTDGLRERLPECAENLERISKQVTDAVSLMFPTRRTYRFERRERSDAVAPPPATSKGRLWRRCVRAIAKALRMPIKFPRKRVSSK